MVVKLDQSPALVFVIEDDPSMLRGVARLLRISGYQVETFATPGLFLEREPHSGRGCALVDLNLPGISGLDLQKTLLDQGSTLPVIIMTAFGDVPATVTAFRAGAVDFLTKPFSDQDLLAAVEKAVTRHGEILATWARKKGALSRLETLTPREREVVVMVGQGLLNKQIAANLDVGEKTVKVHRGRAMKKLEVNSVPELVDLLDAAGAR
jgi:FixJ family two-component response regulator